VSHNWISNYFDVENVRSSAVNKDLNVKLYLSFPPFKEFIFIQNIVHASIRTELINLHWIMESHRLQKTLMSIHWNKRLDTHCIILSRWDNHFANRTQNIRSFKPRPSIIFLYDERSIAVNIFYTQVLKSRRIIDYLGTQFITWVFYRTNDANDEQYVWLN
jgi:hypothetical protein